MIQQRLSIIPEAETFEKPREHKDDIKPSVSNVKVSDIVHHISVDMDSHYNTFSHIVADFLPDPVGHDCSYCAGRLRYYVLPKTKRNIEEIVVTVSHKDQHYGFEPELSCEYLYQIFVILSHPLSSTHFLSCFMCLFFFLVLNFI